MFKEMETIEPLNLGGTDVEWLTTGQMIDRLKVGEVAEAQYETDCHRVGFNYKIKRTPNGLKNITNHDSVVSFDETFFNAKWRIIPQFVSFEEAMDALKKGMIVNFRVPIELDSNVLNFHFSKGNECVLLEMGQEELTFQHLFEGKWSIVG